MNKTQSLAGYIREHLSSYEERLAVGIRQEVIVKELAEAGYETNVFTLRTLLSRARKKRDEQKAAGMAPAPSVISSEPTPGSNQQVTKPSNAKSTSVPLVKAKIENPADVRKAGKREFDIEDYTNPEE